MIGELLTTLLRRRTPDGDPLSDAVLLDRFARTRDQAAFELLVWRHGPMVLSACRRVLRDSHAAEDAFQAAFLVLARKAGTVRGSAAGWLHRVALRVCLRMKRRLPPVPLDAEPAASPQPDRVEAAEQSAILDEEVARLPEWLRLPVILCHLQGHTTEHAAALLGIPRGTVLSRLATARKRLAVRLTARGVAPVLAAVAVTELSADAGRVVAEAATAFTLGKSAHTVPVQHALEVLAMTKRTGVAIVAGVLVLVAGLGTGVGFVTAQGQGPKPTPTTAPADDPKKPPAPIIHGSKQEKLTKMLDAVDIQLKKAAGSDDLDLLRARLQAQELRLAELVSRVRAARAALPPELTDALEHAQERVEAARKAQVPDEVLAEAVKLHPTVKAAQAKLADKRRELQTSKLPKDDAGRKKLSDEAGELEREHISASRGAMVEVEPYLRVPGIVEAQKTLHTVERKMRQVLERVEVVRQEHDIAEKEVAELKAKLAKLEPVAEEIAWLKEKRKRLKQELLELELKELGIGK